MEDKILNKVLEKINKKSDFKDEFISFSDKRYKSVKIDKDNFHKIEYLSSNKKIAFIDGGNAEILRLADLSLQLVRVYYNIFKNNNKIDSKRFDFYVLVEAVNENEEIKYNVDIVPANFKSDIIFDSFDETLREGKHRVKISKIGETVRRFLELNTAKIAIDELDTGDILVIDGSLKASVTNEARFFDELYKKALERDVVISGLSKTCSFLTNKGNSIISVLKSIAPDGYWYYHPIAEINNQDHQAELFFVKLHEKSKYIFRFEVFKQNKFDINEILSLLVDNSKDPIFLGYPYGLIEADKFARVTNNEKEYLKTMLMVKLKKEDLGEKSIDAHSVLDSVG